MSSAVNGMRLAVQDAGDDLADAAEAGDDHMPVIVGQRVEDARATLRLRQQLSSLSKSGVAAIDSVTTMVSSSVFSLLSAPAASRP